MNRIIMIVVLACLAVACAPPDEGSAQSSGQASAPASAWKSTKRLVDTALPVIPEQATGTMISGGPPPATTLPATMLPATSPQEKQAPGLLYAWAFRTEMQSEIDGFMDTGFMKDPGPVGFADLAYSDISLDFTIDGQGRIDQINGKLSELYDSFSFTIPVVERRVDAISGSRQVNWEDVIVRSGETCWQVQPVGLRGVLQFEVRIAKSIEIIIGDSIIRIVKNGSVFSCTEHVRKANGQEELQLSWKIDQYKRGPVYEIQSHNEPALLVPVVMAWEPGSIAGYLVSLPEGLAEFIQRLRWEPAGELETDRYNFLVLLTQRHGSDLNIRDRLGAIDPVWLTLLVYDYVVTQ